MDVRLIPYTILNDSLIIFMIVVCAAFMLLSFSRVGFYLLSEVKSVLYTKNYSSFFHTNVEINFLSLLNILTLIVISLLMAFYKGEEYTLSYLGVVALYFVGKHILYNIVNHTFFELSKCHNWNHTFMLLTIYEGVLCFPFVLIHIFVGFPLKATLICSAVFIILVKFVTIIKAFGVFFRNYSGFLQLIMYFCTLEVVPALILYGVWIK